METLKWKGERYENEQRTFCLFVCLFVGVVICWGVCLFIYLFFFFFACYFLKPLKFVWGLPKWTICDRPPQTSRKVGIFYSEIQGKIHGKVVFWRNWDFNGFEMFISFIKLLAKYQLSFLLQNIWNLTFSRCSCTGNVYKMKTSCFEES